MQIQNKVVGTLWFWHTLIKSAIIFAAILHSAAVSFSSVNSHQIRQLQNKNGKYK